MSEVTITDIIEAIAEGYSDTEDINPWKSMDNAKTVMEGFDMLLRRAENL